MVFAFAVPLKWSNIYILGTNVNPERNYLAVSFLSQAWLLSGPRSQVAPESSGKAWPSGLAPLQTPLQGNRPMLLVLTSQRNLNPQVYLTKYPLLPQEEEGSLSQPSPSGLGNKFHP